MTCPDLRPHFKHIVERPMAHSFGVPVISDWADKADDDPVFGVFKQCGFWTMAEAAILYEAARQLQGDWLDIGGHTGWTAAHIIAAGNPRVDLLDPMYGNEEFLDRTLQNLRAAFGRDGGGICLSQTSDEFFAFMLEGGALEDDLCVGIVIDGDHDRPHPLQDAQNAAEFLRPTGVIMLHDAVGGPVQDAVAWLLDNGFQAKVYLTPHVVACCWRGDFTPPDYQPDSLVRHALQTTLPGWMLELAR
jgi:SAM-dependent methyltransferase